MIDLGDVATVVTAVAVLIAAITSAYVSVKSTRTIKSTHGMVQQIDAAVNGKPPGGSTMVSQVQDLHDRIPPDAPPIEDQDAVLPLLKRLVAKVEQLSKDDV